MLGFYNYTVWLTYGSLVSAVIGIFVSLAGHGHPYIGAIFLLISGLCDAFDGMIARTKTDRTEQEKQYGRGGRHPDCDGGPGHVMQPGSVHSTGRKGRSLHGDTVPGGGEAP